MLSQRFVTWASSIGMVVIFVTWLSFQILVDAVDRDPVINQVFLMYSGAWVAQIMYSGAKAGNNGGGNKNE